MFWSVLCISGDLTLWNWVLEMSIDLATLSSVPLFILPFEMRNCFQRKHLVYIRMEYRMKNFTLTYLLYCHTFWCRTFSHSFTHFSHSFRRNILQYTSFYTEQVNTEIEHWQPQSLHCCTAAVQNPALKSATCAGFSSKSTFEVIDMRKIFNDLWKL